MQEYVARLIRCGFTRDTAVTICRYFRREKTLHDLAQYVDEVERENGEVANVLE